MKIDDDSMAAQFKELLVRREAELSAALAASEARGAPGRATQGDVVDFKDLADASSAARIDDMEAEHAALELEQVLAALHRLHEGSYGRCSSCDEPIDLRRLTVMPATRFCVDCQSMQEWRAAQAHSN